MRNKTYGIVALLVCATLGMTAAPLAAATHDNPPACPSTPEDTLTFDDDPVSGTLDNDDPVRYDIALSSTQSGGTIRFWDPTPAESADAGQASFVVYEVASGSCGSTVVQEGTLTPVPMSQGLPLDAGKTYAIVVYLDEHGPSDGEADFNLRVSADPV